MPRLVLAVVWLAAASVTGGLVAIVYGLAGGPPLRPHPMPIEKIPVSRRDANPWAAWSVTESLSAHGVLIVQVETHRLGEARAVARQLADPIKSRYAEILMYFHRPGRPDVPAPRRVQWTPKDGYVETVYDDTR